MVRVDLNDKEKYNKPETWETLVEEDGKDVLEWAAALKGDVMMVCSLQNARHVIQHRSLGTGDLVRIVDELPVGSVSGFFGNRKEDTAFVKLTSFVSPGSVYKIDVSGGDSCEVELFSQTELSCGDYKPEDLVTEQVFVQSKDGTEVPMVRSWLLLFAKICVAFQLTRVCVRFSS